MFVPLAESRPEPVSTVALLLSLLTVIGSGVSVPLPVFTSAEYGCVTGGCVPGLFLGLSPSSVLVMANVAFIVWLAVTAAALVKV